MSDELNKTPEIKLDKDLNLLKDFPVPEYSEWKAIVEQELNGAPFDKKLVTNTYEGISLQPLYVNNDSKDLPHVSEMPGFKHYVRGTKPEGFVQSGWEISQEIPYPLAEEFNEALRYDLTRGQNSITLPIDRATKKGLDADYAKVGEVGDGGVSISGLNSITRAFSGIDLTKYPVHVACGYSAFPLTSLLAAYCKKNETDTSKLSGSITSDPLGFLAQEGAMPVHFDDSIDEMTAVLRWANAFAPNIRTIGVDSTPYHNAGASAVQELAFALASGVEYAGNLLAKGIQVNDVFRSFRFTFAIGSNYFMEIAKFRAARYMWSKIATEFGASEEAVKMVINAKTSRYNKTKYDPYVNMLRTTTEAFSGAIAGVDSMHTGAFDEVFGLPSEFSRRIARNTQIILGEESHLDAVVDPAGGSYYVEKLTADVIAAAWKLFQEIEAKGGMQKALAEGFPQAEVNKVAVKRLEDIAKRKSVVVGNNMYANTKEEKIADRLPEFQAIHDKRAEYLQKFRVSGDHEKNVAILKQLEDIANTKNQQPIVTAMEAALAGASLGEIAKAFRASAKGSMSITPLPSLRSSEQFEKMRDAVEAFAQKNGAKPTVFLANMGSVKQHKGRADFSRGFFETAGFLIDYSVGLSSPEEAAKAAAESSASICVLCSTDETYPEIVPTFVKEVKSLKSDMAVVLAGYPKDQIESHKAAGVDEFIFLGADVYTLLSKLLNKIGASVE